MEPTIERWYSMKEICEYLGVSRENRPSLEIQDQRGRRLDEVRRGGG